MNLYKNLCKKLALFLLSATLVITQASATKSDKFVAKSTVIRGIIKNGIITTGTVTATNAIAGAGVGFCMSSLILVALITSLELIKTDFQAKLAAILNNKTNDKIVLNKEILNFLTKIVGKETFSKLFNSTYPKIVISKAYFLIFTQALLRAIAFNFTHKTNIYFILGTTASYALAGGTGGLIGGLICCILDFFREQKNGYKTNF